MSLALKFDFPLTKPERLKEPYLLACPFCKAPAHKIVRAGQVRIECKACGSASVEANDEAGAVSRWNRRLG